MSQRQQRHSWRELDEDGETVYYKAVMHGKEWTFETQMKGDEEWTRHDPIQRHQWVMLREILWRKYQRKRTPWKLIERIDKLLEDMPEESSE